MKFDFSKAASAFVPSLKQSFGHAVAGAALGLFGGVQGAILGAIIGGGANTLVGCYQAGNGTGTGAGGATRRQAPRL